MESNWELSEAQIRHSFDDPDDLFSLVETFLFPDNQLLNKGNLS